MLLVACLFDCSMETASDHNFHYSPAFQLSKRSPRCWSWLGFWFLPPRRQALRTHFETAKIFCHSVSVSGASTHSREMLDSSWNHLPLNLIGTKRQVGTFEIKLSTRRAFGSFRTFLSDQHFQNMSNSTDWITRDQKIVCFIWDACVKFPTAAQLLFVFWIRPYWFGIEPSVLFWTKSKYLILVYWLHFSSTWTL